MIVMFYCWGTCEPWGKQQSMLLACVTTSMLVVWLFHCCNLYYLLGGTPALFAKLSTYQIRSICIGSGK